MFSCASWPSVYLLWRDVYLDLLLSFWLGCSLMSFVSCVICLCCCCSVAQSYPTLCNPMDCSTPGSLVLHYLREFAQTQVHWVNDAIQPSHPLSPTSPPALSFPASVFFPMNWLFVSGGLSIGASALASVLPMNIQGWFPLGLTSLIYLLSKRLSRVFSRTTVQKHHFFSTQPSLWSNSNIYYWKNDSFNYMDLCQQSDVSAF